MNKSIDQQATDRKRVAFLTTRWTQVFHASDPTHPRYQAAYTELFQDYWEPIYAYLRRWGLDPHDAEDALQGFFLYAYERRTFGKADRKQQNLSEASYPIFGLISRTGKWLFL